MAEKVNLDNAVDWNDYGVSVEGQPQVKIRGGQETPEWFDYEAYRKAQGKGGDWSAPEMKNPDTLTKIRSALARVKEAPEVLGYAAHKVADPMYANVDYMGQQVGDWAAKKINNIARAFDVSPEARQYGRFEEEEYDPEAVDVRFGRNAYKEGYDNLGDYLEAKDQEKVDRYRGYNHANRFAPIENADDKFYTLSDTQTMEDWQPETTSGKIAKGAIETAGNMLPENLKALMEEKGIEGGAKMLGTLSPVFKELKSRKEASKFLDERAKSNRLVGNEAAAARYEDLAKQKRGSFEQLRDDFKYHAQRRKAIEEALMSDPGQAKRLKDAKDTLSTDAYEEYLDTMERMNGNTPIWAHNNAINLQERLNPKDSPANLKSIARNANRTPKPLPNPAAQRAEAITKMGYNPTQYPELKEIEHLYPEYVALGRKGVENLDEFEKARFVEIAERLANLGFFSE